MDFQEHLPHLRELGGADHIEPRIARNGDGRDQTATQPAVWDRVHRAFGYRQRGTKRNTAGSGEVLRLVSTGRSPLPLLSIPELPAQLTRILQRGFCGL